MYKAGIYNHLHTNPHKKNKKHRYNQSLFALLLVPSNLPEVNQRIIDTSTSLEHDYQNNPYSIDATSNPSKWIKSNCATYVHLPQLNKTASTINTLQVSLVIRIFHSYFIVYYYILRVHQLINWSSLVYSPRHCEIRVLSASQAHNLCAWLLIILSQLPSCIIVTYR